MRRHLVWRFSWWILALFLFLPGGSYASLIALGDNFSCAWDGRSSVPVQCTGDNSSGQLEGAEKIFNPFQMGAGAEHLCALFYKAEAFGGRGITCIGEKSNRYQEKSVPPQVQNPQMLSVGRWHNLAIYEPEAGVTKVACWGRNDLKQCDIPELRNPSAVYASIQKSLNYSCALHQGGKLIRCWGDINVEVPAATFPAVESGLPLVCEDMGTSSVNCWSNRSQSKNPNMVVTNDVRSCRLDSNGVNCFDSFGRPDPIPYEFHHPVSIAVSVTHACVIDDTGSKCWGCGPRQTACQKNPNLQFGPSFEQLADSGAFLETLSQFVYDFDSDFLQAVHQLLDTHRAQTVMILRALRPYLMEFGYRHLKKEYIERAIFTLDKLVREEEKSGRKSDKASKNSTALRLLAVSLSTSKPVLSEKAQKTAQKIVAELGSVGENEKLPEALARNISSFYRTLGASPYLAGRIVMGEGIIAMLSASP